MLINGEMQRDRKRRVAAFRIPALWLLWLAPYLAVAQGPPETNPPAKVFYTHTRTTPQGRVPDATIAGSSATPLPNKELFLWKDFYLRAYRDGQTNLVQVIAQAPQCTVDYKSGREFVSDPGPLRIFTPDSNLWVQGVGFFCSETNEILIISNQVETRVAESMLRSSLLPGPTGAATERAGMVLHIHSEHAQFNYKSNIVDYAGNVVASDPLMEMHSPFLTIQFSNGQSVQSILAWNGVMITLTNKGTATGQTASYFATNGTELLKLNGDAEWHNGQQEAKASTFTYDPDRHFLIADEQVRVRWPNPVTNLSAPVTFRELWADHSTLQMSTNGEEVDAMTSEGNVILVNQTDQSRANADKATYDRTNDLFELTGEADWRKDKMEVLGDKLSVTSFSSNPVSHAQGNAQLKIQFGQSTNRWLYINADDSVHQTLNAQTNLATFRGNVHARVLQDGQLQDSLTSQVLLVYLDSSNKVETAVARGNVRAETAADAQGVKKTISCGALTAHFSPLTTQLRSVMAEENVVMELSGSSPAAPDDKLTAAIVTAYFSPVTNQVENAVASGDVVFDQTKGAQKIHATGARAVYDLAPVEQFVLTGRPFAQKDKIQITRAERLIWDMKSGGLNAFGPYHIVSSRNTNPPAP
jgi:lipopolysaccharide export system protein LptA